MSALSEALGNAAVPHTITHKGKTYTVSLLDQRAKTAFEKWNFERDKERLKAVKDILPSDEYMARAAALSDAWMAGDFNFESEASQAAMTTEKGMMALVRILTGCTEEEVLFLTAECGEDLNQTLQVVFKESLPEVTEAIKAKMLKAQEENAGPNSPAPGPNGSQSRRTGARPASPRWWTSSGRA